MKHIDIGSEWKFSHEPFGAFRVELVYGANKRQAAFLASNVTPEMHYQVHEGGFHGKLLYEGPNKLEAEKAKADFGAAVEHRLQARTTVTSGTLPEGKFRLITTAKGAKMIVPGNDESTDALVFVGCEEGFRGGVSLETSGTTGEVIKRCQAGNALRGRIEVICLLKVGQSVAFYSHGSRTNDVYLYTWDGTQVAKKVYTKSEWEIHQEAAKADAEQPVEETSQVETAEVVTQVVEAEAQAEAVVVETPVEFKTETVVAEAQTEAVVVEAPVEAPVEVRTETVVVEAKADTVTDGNQTVEIPLALLKRLIEGSSDAEAAEEASTLLLS